MDNTIRQITVVLVVLIALMVVYSFLPAQNKPLGEDEVRALVLNDVYKTYPDSKIKFLTFSRENDNWNASVKISLEGESACCPRVFVRDYNLFPIRYREERIVSNCVVGDLIFLEEEAVVASCRDSYVSSISKDRLPTTTRVLGREVDAAKACVDGCTAIQVFLQGVPSQNLWVVQWANNETTAFVAISDKGEVLAVQK